MRHLVTVIDWYGPYNSLESAKQAAKADYAGGLYLCIGQQEHEVDPPSIQYVGIAQQDMATRVNEYHHALTKVKRGFKLWMGEVSSLESPGRRHKQTRPSLDYAEWCLTYFLDVRLNQKKTKRPPDRPITVFNRWWKTDYETPYRKRPHPDWPDLIDFLGTGHKARLVWFKNVKSIEVG